MSDIENKPGTKSSAELKYWTREQSEYEQELADLRNRFAESITELNALGNQMQDERNEVRRQVENEKRISEIISSNCRKDTEQSQARVAMLREALEQCLDELKNATKRGTVIEPDSNLYWLEKLTANITHALSATQEDRE